eukprot:9043349-Pyramimonas_sp.AAC.1
MLGQRLRLAIERLDPREVAARRSRAPPRADMGTTPRRAHRAPDAVEDVGGDPLPPPGAWSS